MIAPEEAVRLARLADPRHAAQLAEQASRALELDTQIAELEGLADALSERLGRREITLGRYDKAMGPVDADLAELRRQRDQLDTPDGEAVALGEARERIQAVWDAAKARGDTKAMRAMLKQGLAGYRLVVKPLPRTAPRNHDPRRITVEKIDGS